MVKKSAQLTVWIGFLWATVKLYIIVKINNNNNKHPYGDAVLHGC